MKGQFPWIGRSKGSAGGMTTCKINDKNVMRAKAFEVTNPNTPAQQMQRDFFKQVQEVSASVTEDQLRSLFGVKPKTMTRRNALSKQIAAAYTIEDGVKSVDFSKLLAIGNGEKVTTPIIYFNDTNYDGDVVITREMLGVESNQNPNIIIIVFSPTRNRILIQKSDQVVGDNVCVQDCTFEDELVDGDYMYATCATSAENVETFPFGTFTIKTRATD